ncbi:MAG: hypothetical protein EKK34_12620 [Mycobacterium sp.]|nr:MAG: hypothetical protein EKK34_12620 [Mycobacterium sp.]
MASSTDLGLEVSPPTIDELLREYDDWSKTADRTDDDWDLVTKTKELYRFAIANYNEPGIELLLRAIRAFEAAKRD